MKETRSLAPSVLSVLSSCEPPLTPSATIPHHMPHLAIVTGGAGFLGSHLVDALIAKKWEVVMIDNLSTGRKQNVNPRAAFTRLDIRSPRASALIAKLHPRAVFHLAAQASVSMSVRHPLQDAEIN